MSQADWIEEEEHNKKISPRTGRPFKCSTCGSIEDLVPHGKYFKNKCRSCDSKRRKSSYQINHELEKEYRRKYSRSNRNKCNSHKRNSYAKNIEKERERSRKKSKSDHGRVRSLLNSAIRSGKIKKPQNCSRCLFIGQLHAHHFDYAKPYDVIWLCIKCHGKEHRKYD